HRRATIAVQMRTGGARVRRALVSGSMFFWRFPYHLPRGCAPNGTSQGSPNHLTRASGPATVFTRIADGNGEIVATSVAPLLCTRGATGVIVPPDSSFSADIVEDAKFGTVCIRMLEDARISVVLRRELRWHLKPLHEACHVALGDLLKSQQVRHLGFERVIRAVEPEPLVCRAMNAERSTKGITKFTGLQFFLLGKDLNTLGQSCALHRHLETAGQVVDVNPAVASQQGLFCEDPEVTSTPRFFQRRIYAILA